MTPRDHYFLNKAPETYDENMDHSSFSCTDFVGHSQLVYVIRIKIYLKFVFYKGHNEQRTQRNLTSTIIPNMFGFSSGWNMEIKPSRDSKPSSFSLA